jgi:hypothetical protein
MTKMSVLCVVTIWIASFAPHNAWAIGAGPPIPLPDVSCDRIDYEYRSWDQPAPVKSGIYPFVDRTCAVPVGGQVVTNPSTPITWEYSRQINSLQDLREGDDCTGRYLSGPTYVKQNDSVWSVWWKDPANVLHTTFASDSGLTDPKRPKLTLLQEGRPKYLEPTGPWVGFNLIQIPMVYWGRWHIVNDQGQCLAPRWEPEHDLVVKAENSELDPAVVLTGYVPDPPGGPIGSVPREPIRRILRDPLTLSPGQIAVAPMADRGLVNLAQHAWIEGATVQEQSVWEMVASSAPDATGRALRYQYYITVGLSGVEWKWGDGSGTDWWPDLGEPGSAGRNATHKYTVISARGGAGPAVNGAASYLVEAVEHYTVDVVAVWFDGRGTRRQDLGDLGLSFDQSPASLGVYVGQVEGVPSS